MVLLLFRSRAVVGGLFLAQRGVQLEEGALDVPDWVFNDST